MELINCGLGSQQATTALAAMVARPLVLALPLRLQLPSVDPHPTPSGFPRKASLGCLVVVVVAAGRAGTSLLDPQTNKPHPRR